MKTITAMEMRKHMGEYIDEVRIKSETIILERSGKPVAMLVPFNDTPSAPNRKRKRIDKKIRALKQLSGISADAPRSKNIDSWLKKERDNWDEI